jgi:hypothetical protein
MISDYTCSETESVEKYYDPDGFKLISARGLEFTATLKTEQLIVACMEFSKIETPIAQLSHGAVLTDDPFAYCPSCASNQKSFLKNGTSVPSVPLSVATDGINAANRFLSAGRSQSAVQACTTSYIGSLAEKVVEDYRNGTLRNLAKERALLAAQKESEREGLLPACGSALTCNRPTASHKGELEQHGMVAVVCPHIIPGLGLATPMLTFEQHYYYDVVLGDVLRRRPDTKVVYLDLACRYKGRWELLLERLVKEDILANDVRSIRLLLPWMHAFDHDQECQLQYSALYQEGVARRVGEQTEALWSLVKPFCKRARYMTRAHWQDHINQMLWQITLKKQRNFPVMLSRRMKRINLLLERYEREVNEVIAEANLAGVSNLQESLAALQEGRLCTAANELSLKAKYVEALVKLRSHDNLAKEKAVLPLLVPGNVGIHMHQKGTAENERAKLVRARDRLAVQLELPLGEHWTEESLEFKNGFQELASFIIDKYEKLVEEQVFKRRLVSLELEKSESGKNSQKLRKSINAITGNIRNLVNVRASWLSETFGGSEFTVSESFIQDVLHGRFPWADNSASGRNGSMAAQLHYAKRYRFAQSQLNRTKEESDLIKKEVTRMLNWIEEQTDSLESLHRRQLAIKELCERQLFELDQQNTNAAIDHIDTANRLATADGLIQLIARDRKWLTCMSNDAKYHFGE